MAQRVCHLTSFVLYSAIIVKWPWSRISLSRYAICNFPTQCASNTVPAVCSLVLVVHLCCRSNCSRLKLVEFPYHLLQIRSKHVCSSNNLRMLLTLSNQGSNPKKMTRKDELPSKNTDIMSYCIIRV